MKEIPQLCKEIKAIFFDVNGTLRMREPHEATQAAAYKRFLDILGKDQVSEDYWFELEKRYKAYSVWAQVNLVQLSESEIWTRWILPDESPEIVSARAADLMLAWIERKGHVIPRPGVEEVLRELLKRGYQLGLISNSISTLDIPNFLVEFGWTEYFKTVVLSSYEKSRKPAPDLFNIAARRCQLQPSQCAHVGNRFSKDIVGCKNAHYSLGIILESSENQIVHQKGNEIMPDVTIGTLNDLLALFPAVG